MELPHIGENCSELACRQLDFLPFTCPLCKKVYCLQHQKLTAHNCPHAGSQDVRVPVCPLCDQAVPAPRGQPPDVAISQHLDDNCHVKKQRIFKNKCAYASCKKKELMPITCPECGLNFCIPHRHFTDHDCPRTIQAGHARGTASVPPSNSGGMLQALREQATSRFAQYTSNSSQVTGNRSSGNNWVQQQQQQQQEIGATGASRNALSQMQGGLSEDEALARALSQSVGDAATTATTTPNSNSTTAESQDEQLQRAIAASLRDTGRSNNRNRRNNSNSECNLL